MAVVVTGVGGGDEDLLQPAPGPVDRPVLLRRPLRPEHGEAELEGEQLGPGQPHGAEEMVGGDLDRVLLEEDAERLDEPAGDVEPVAQGADVAQQHRPIHPRAGGHLGDRVRLAVPEVRDQVKDAAELGGSPTAAVRGVAQKASPTLSGLSFQRLQALAVDDRGNLQVQSGGRLVPAMTLPPADRDVVYLALKLALVEQALTAGKLIAVSDDAFGGLSEGARRFAARLLKQIARPGQLVHATTDPSFKEAADHAA